MLLVQRCGVSCAAGLRLLRDCLSVMGLRLGFLEAYARELYSERSTALSQRRAAEAFCRTPSQKLPLNSLLVGQ